MQCGDEVCLTVDDALNLTNWIHAMEEVEQAIERCVLVRRGNS